MNSNNRHVIVKNLGSVTYEEVWTLQENLFNEIINVKLENRKLAPTDQKQTPNYLVFCEHPHVYTLGRRGSGAHMLSSQKIPKKQRVSLHKVNRGGDITYHGPGQLVVYPILDLENFFTDIHHYLRLLEEAVIATLQDFGLSGGRIGGLTGVWLNHESSFQAVKLCSIGIRTSRWVTMHGLALNVNTDLSYFEQIVPCGIQDKNMTSMATALGKPQDLSLVASRLECHLLQLFEMISVL